MSIGKHESVGLPYNMRTTEIPPKFAFSSTYSLREIRGALGLSDQSFPNELDIIRTNAIRGLAAEDPRVEKNLGVGWEGTGVAKLRKAESLNEIQDE